MGVSQLPWGIEALTSVKHTNINIREVARGRRAHGGYSQNLKMTVAPPSFVKGTVLLATSH